MKKRVFHYVLLGLVFAALATCVIGYRTLRKTGYLDRRLLKSASWGRTLSLRFLLKMGADVNAKNDWGETPLICAVDSGNIAAARLLIENGADVNVKDKQGLTVLMRAIMPSQAFAGDRGDYANYSNVVIAEMLLENGTALNARSDKGDTVLMDMLNKICRIDEDEAYFLVRFLIARGIDINAKNDDGCTALNYAVGIPRIHPLLIDAGAEYGCSRFGIVCT
jgi:ankyrin repeat protein